MTATVMGGKLRPQVSAALAVLALVALGLTVASRSVPTAVPRQPRTLRVGVLPDQGRERLQAIYVPLVQYLDDTLGLRTELVITGAYEQLLERFHRGEIDLAYFGGATFVRAERRDGAVPLVMRIVDRHPTSIVIARAGLAGRFPEDFGGRSFVFGARASTSGHLMPRYFFERMGLVPEQYFATVAHLPHHDAVIAAIQEGRADAGVVNGSVLSQLIADGSCDAHRIRQVWESPPFADYVWAASPRLSQALQLRMRDAFLKLDAVDPAHRRIMAPLGARAYVPATRADFDLVRGVVMGGARHSSDARR